MVLLNHIDLDGNNFQNSDVVENGRYSIEGSNKFAEYLLPQLETLC